MLSFVCKQSFFFIRCSDHKRMQQLLVTGGWYFSVMKTTQQGMASVCSAESHSTILIVLRVLGKVSSQQCCQIPQGFGCCPNSKISNTVTHRILVAATLAPHCLPAKILASAALYYSDLPPLAWRKVNDCPFLSYS